MKRREFYQLLPSILVFFFFLSFGVLRIMRIKIEREEMAIKRIISPIRHIAISGDEKYVFLHVSLRTPGSKAENRIVIFSLPEFRKEFALTILEKPLGFQWLGDELFFFTNDAKSPNDYDLWIVNKTKNGWKTKRLFHFSNPYKYYPLLNPPSEIYLRGDDRFIKLKRTNSVWVKQVIPLRVRIPVEGEDEIGGMKVSYLRFKIPLLRGNKLFYLFFDNCSEKEEMVEKGFSFSMLSNPLFHHYFRVGLLDTEGNLKWLHGIWVKGMAALIGEIGPAPEYLKPNIEKIFYATTVREITNATSLILWRVDLVREKVEVLEYSLGSRGYPYKFLITPNGEIICYSWEVCRPSTKSKLLILSGGKMKEINCPFSPAYARIVSFPKSRKLFIVTYRDVRVLDIDSGKFSKIADISNSLDLACF